MDSVNLIGAEDVKTAGCRIKTAAESMKETMTQLDNTLLYYFNRNEELVKRIETSMEKVNINFMDLDDEDFEGLLERMKRMREVENG